VIASASRRKSVPAKGRPAKPAQAQPPSGTVHQELAPTEPAAAAAPDTELPAGTVRAVVISDIHASMKPVAGETHVAQATAANGQENPLTGARAFLADQIGAADLILCPGDMVHRGDPNPMDWVWQELQGIASELGAVLVGSAGNHDLLAKPKGGHEPQEKLRALRPFFPHVERDCVLTYWSEHFAVVESERFRVISLNTCCTHGGFDQSEGKHGRLKDYSLDAVREHLKGAASHPAVNICMCHHHPQEWSHGGEHVTQHVLGGDLLIDLLDERDERWTLLHGHKHYPALGYFGHSSHGPVRLAAASLGVNLMSDTGVEVRNQIHVVDFAVTEAERLGLALAGEIRSFTWQGAGEWAPAGEPMTPPILPEHGRRRGRLPALAGFGYRRDGHELAAELIERAGDKGVGVCSWQEMIDGLQPRARFLSPDDRDELVRGLRRLGAGVSEDAATGFVEVTFP
jgi:hypothetical protein